jgi:serine/threonine protein kinase
MVKSMTLDDSTRITGEPTRAEPISPRRSDSHLRPGEQVGRYIVLSTLGSGGMSVVYLAYDPELDRRVALKLMRAGGLGTMGRARLAREAQALARLSHPNVVPVYDVGAHGDQTFMAMEHVSGETLRRWMKRPRRWREVVQVMAEAGRGLVAAHAAGIVHRDFKPDNVLIGEDGRVRVVDFGLAREVADLDGSGSGERSEDSDSLSSRGKPPAAPAPPPDEPPVATQAAPPMTERTPPTVDGDLAGVTARPSQQELDALRDVSYDESLAAHRHGLESVTRADHIVGTPAYMAPEQMRRGATDERADQFSFCATLYEALYRRKPFSARKVVAKNEMLTAAERPRALERQIADAPPRDAGVPRWLERLVLRGLAADPVHRFADMHALLATLARDLGARRRRVAAALVLAGAAALALAAVTTLRREAARPVPCRGGEARFAEAWDARGADQVRQGFAASKLAWAPASADGFVRGMDDYRDAWVTQHREACEATRLRGEQSEAALDLRMTCLERRRAQAAALVDVMRHADTDTMLGAGAAPAALPPLSDCEDAVTLASVARPSEPAALARLEPLRKRLDEVAALYAAGRTQAALDAANALRADLDREPYPAAAAELELRRGRAAADLGAEGAADAFRDAFTLAMSARDDVTMAEAAARLAQEHLYAGAMDAFRTWVQVARAAISRGGSPSGHLDEFVGPPWPRACRRAASSPSGS